MKLSKTTINVAFILLHIQALRKRVRKNSEKGVVSKGFGADRRQIVRLLSERITKMEETHATLKEKCQVLDDYAEGACLKNAKSVALSDKRQRLVPMYCTKNKKNLFHPCPVLIDPSVVFSKGKYQGYKNESI